MTNFIILNEFIKKHFSRIIVENQIVYELKNTPNDNHFFAKIIEEKDKVIIVHQHQINNHPFSGRFYIYKDNDEDKGFQSFVKQLYKINPTFQNISRFSDTFPKERKLTKV